MSAYLCGTLQCLCSRAKSSSSCPVSPPGCVCVRARACVPCHHPNMLIGQERRTKRLICRNCCLHARERVVQRARVLLLRSRQPLHLPQLSTFGHAASSIARMRESPGNRAWLVAWRGHRRGSHAAPAPRQLRPARALSLSIYIRRPSGAWGQALREGRVLQERPLCKLPARCRSAPRALGPRACSPGIATASSL